MLILIAWLRERAGQIWKQHLSRLTEQKGIQTEEVGIWGYLKKLERERKWVHRKKTLGINRAPREKLDLHIRLPQYSHSFQNTSTISVLAISPYWNIQCREGETSRLGWVCSLTFLFLIIIIWRCSHIN